MQAEDVPLMDFLNIANKFNFLRTFFFHLLWLWTCFRCHNYYPTTMIVHKTFIWSWSWTLLEKDPDTGTRQHFLMYFIKQEKKCQICFCYQIRVKDEEINKMMKTLLKIKLLQRYFSGVSQRYSSSFYNIKLPIS